MERKVVTGIMLAMLFIGMLPLAFNIQPIKASGTIYIRANGSVEGTDKIATADNVTYTFTDNIYDSIVIERDNIVIDGSGYTVEGTGTGTGIYLSGRSNVTIKNMEIKAFEAGIYLEYSSNNAITGDNITDNMFYGILFDYSSNNRISGNTITANNDTGVYLYESSNNTITGDNMTNNEFYGIVLFDHSLNNTMCACMTANNGLFGIWVWESAYNWVYHNNFLDNIQLSVLPLTTYPNFWDDGYPSGGNYWGNYNGNDSYRGPYQNETGSDGIGDTRYITVIGSNATQWRHISDRYPLMGPFGGITNQGTHVAVFPSENVGLIFESVAAGGSVTVNESLAGPDPPSGFMISSGIYYDIKTTATYSGTILIRIIYDDSGMTPDQESNLKLMQWNETSNSWVDITQRVDTENNVIYGEASHFSIVAVVARTPISWEFVFQDPRRGTTLKISTDDKYFQFIAPNKDFGVKHDPNMIVSPHLIIIRYGDPELRLDATAVHDKIDFCLAIAWDKTTGKKYLLID
jgi:parallel beta-helix repeat protein